MFNNNDSSMLWLIILFMLANNGANFAPPTDEEMCKVFTTTVDTFLEDNKAILDKANLDSPLWQLKTLRSTFDDIEDPKTRLKVIEVAMSIVRNIETVNKFACGGLPTDFTDPQVNSKE